MSQDTFYYLLGNLEQKIKKQDTSFRMAIPPEEMLVVTPQRLLVKCVKIVNSSTTENEQICRPASSGELALSSPATVPVQVIVVPLPLPASGKMSNTITRILLLRLPARSIAVAGAGAVPASGKTPNVISAVLYSERSGCSREPSTAQSIIEDHDIVAEDISESDTDDSSSISGSPHEDDCL
nr:unnamed protein product [Callosobruchus chinensis]